MVNLVALSNETHGNVQVTEHAAVAVAADQHILRVRVAEVAQAVTSFPVFAARGADTGRWDLFAVTSLEGGKNLFVVDNQWTANYQPNVVRCCPLYLVPAEGQDKPYAVGIDVESPAVVQEGGIPLYDESGQPSVHLTEVTRLLETDLQQELQTRHFFERLDSLKLTRQIEVNVGYADGSGQSITDLNTIDEDRLKDLSDADLKSLHESGYLLVIHAMLVSLHQLNSLIRLHNDGPAPTKIKQVRLSMPRGGESAAI